MRKASLILETSQPPERRATKILRDNPFLARLIEVGTKALRRGLMSGETLRAPRQQLRRLRASVFDLFTKLPAIARLFGARRVLSSSGQALHKRAVLTWLIPFFQIQKTVRSIRKNLTQVSAAVSADSNRRVEAALSFLREALIA